jgi:glycosyltransferase involved in cell wall biosynthesis
MRNESAVLSLLSKVNRKLAAAVIRWLAPFGKYRMFSQVFAPHVATVKPDIVYAHDLICLPAAYDAAQACGARLVYDAHELEVHRNPPLPFVQKRFVSYVEGKYGRKADAVITVGRKVGEVLGEHLGRKDINVIYNSPIIEPCKRNVRSDLGVDRDTPVLLYVGKVTAGRGVGEFLAILPKLRGVLFATVGPCDDKIRMLLERQADRLGVSAATTRHSTREGHAPACDDAVEFGRRPIDRECARDAHRAWCRPLGRSEGDDRVGPGS